MSGQQDGGGETWVASTTPPKRDEAVETDVVMSAERPMESEADPLPIPFAQPRN